MTAPVAILLGVMLLAGPDDGAADREASARVAAESAAAVGDSSVRVRDESVTIDSGRSDFDREAHVALFDRSVRVDYSGDCQLYADRVFAFLDASNRLERIVALGNVAISNGVQSGACAHATFRRAAGEIEMFGDEISPASLEDGSENRIFGRRIRFWLDAEQVEVVGSTITVNKGKGDLRLL